MFALGLIPRRAALICSERSFDREFWLSAFHRDDDVRVTVSYEHCMPSFPRAASLRASVAANFAVS
jgi:hypothetical protein